MLIHRRSLILGIGSILASPAIVRAGSIMPVKTMIWDGRVPVTLVNYAIGSGHGEYLTYAIRGGLSWKVWDPYGNVYRTIFNGLDPYQGDSLPRIIVDNGPHETAVLSTQTARQRGERCRRGWLGTV